MCTDWWIFGATIFAGIMAAVATCFAVIYTNKKTAERYEEDKKPKLAYVLHKDFEPEPDSQGIKTNPSGWQLVCQNIGQVPVFVQSIAMCDVESKRTRRKNKPRWYNLLTLELEQELSALKPFESITIPINNQEFKSIKWLCKESKAEKCLIEADISGGFVVISEIDLYPISILIQLEEGAERIMDEINGGLQNVNK